MGTSKTEVNLRRLIAAAPSQQNQPKLVHYVATLREMLEQLSQETTPQGLPRVSKAVLNDYSDKIEAIASRLAAPSSPPSDVQESQDQPDPTLFRESPSKKDEQQYHAPSSPTSGLRRRSVPSSSADGRAHDISEADPSGPVKLDATARAHIDKQRELQEVLTDEMVVLARQLKEGSLLMNQSIENTEKILDSTEEAIEHSLASTGHANVRATKIYSESSRTSCLTWLIMFLMTCIFVMVVLLIRVT